MSEIQINFPFTGLQLTEQVNRVPNVYGLLNALNVFPTEGSVSTVVEIRVQNDELVVLKSEERGDPARLNQNGEEKALYFKIPHFPLLDTILPKDIQDAVESAGRGLRPRTLEDEVSKRLITIRNKHAITREYVRMGALKGQLKDGAGRVLHNLYTAFGFEKKTVFFNLDNANSDILSKVEEVVQYIEARIGGDTMNGVEILVDTVFFNKLTQHAKVKEFYVNWQRATAITNPETFTGGGITGRLFPLGRALFREYAGVVPVKNAKGEVTSEPLIAAGMGHARPTGTQNTFATYDAPANDIRFVNTPGEEVYVSPEILKHGKGVELFSESNPLAICKRPDILVECSQAAS